MIVLAKKEKDRNIKNTNRAMVKLYGTKK